MDMELFVKIMLGAAFGVAIYTNYKVLQEKKLNPSRERING